MLGLARLHTASLPTPVGRFSFAINLDGALVAAAFVPPADLAPLCGPDVVLDPTPDAATTAVGARFAAYFADARQALHDLPLAPRIGTTFQNRVWRTLALIPCGQTWSYARLAAELGSSPRAVGSANAANPLSVVLPCHRVIGANGALTGYAGGLERKRWLLAHEGAALL